MMSIAWDRAIDANHKRPRARAAEWPDALPWRRSPRPAALHARPTTYSLRFARGPARPPTSTSHREIDQVAAVERRAGISRLEQIAGTGAKSSPAAHRPATAARAADSYARPSRSA